MGSDNLFRKRKAIRRARKEEIKKQKPSNWLVVCEGTKTEPNYFKSAIDEINKKLPDNSKLKVNVVGCGENTLSLVKTAEDLQSEYDKYLNEKVVPYGKKFVVFDKDDFDDEQFNRAVDLCKKCNFIPLWSNQAIEFWFLLHFYYIDSKMNRRQYAEKIDQYFMDKGLKNKYKKNDPKIYKKLCQYGSVENARKNAEKVFKQNFNGSPAKAESCTTVYKFFDEIDETIDELK